MSLLNTYLIAINAIAFVLFGADKRRAISNEWRIPEKTLLFVCLIGGSIGGFLGMMVFHHKTSKPLFSIGVPVIIAIHIALAVWFINRSGYVVH